MVVGNGDRVSGVTIVPLWGRLKIRQRWRLVDTYISCHKSVRICSISSAMRRSRSGRLPRRRAARKRRGWVMITPVWGRPNGAIQTV